MGAASSSVRRFLVSRKISMVTTPFMRSAEYVTPQRIGGRVAPTNSASAVSP
jgi:hypothetical protein